ncbi:hypothetical protein HYX08_04300 [Candidatus Woesearchaeota archaeon]|nr:hypothetical protein [Candidatus Woesearchaeota archaeon]
MDINKLLKYDFTKWFVEGKLSEKKFLDELIEKVDTDETFRENTGIISLETEELNRVVNELKVYSKRKHPTRRGILKSIAAGMAASVIGLKGMTTSAEARNTPYIEPKTIYRELLKIPELKPENNPIFSSNPNTPTIILIQDFHRFADPKQGWEREFRQLELLRTKFGINFVGIEGWAGHEIDKKRGFVFLNAEEMLIEKIMHDPNYEVIGLENEEFQVHTFEVEMSLDYMLHDCLYQEITRILKYLGASQEVVDKFFGYSYSVFDSTNPHADPGPENRNIEFLKNAAGWNLFLGRRIANNNQIKDLTNRFIYLLRRFSANYTKLYGIKKINKEIITKKSYELRKKVGFLFFLPCKVFYDNGFISSFYKDERYKKYDEYVSKGLRDKFAVNKMIGYMKSLNKKIGIIVFGAGHTDGLVNELSQQSANAVNIIILENPEKNRKKRDKL